ncbi:hypothetical protein [Pseudoalteromonas luteoviolacea]|uniref:hypothetical protein n=1 Tax=Pseudoalteromonas luteoviolacea TaxID=43657 RepID=UPI001B39434C|nr:hypothetical protein [Pseudoalteromonas luteoviolacea]MBQ4839798.1 hypothetical protein [Pseudoalteromonas luteoviolacea]
MNEDKKRRGAPKKPTSEKRTARLGVVQVTEQQLGDYETAWELAGKRKSDWIRDTLDAEAKRTINKHKKTAK